MLPHLEAALVGDFEVYGLRLLAAGTWQEFRSVGDAKITTAFLESSSKTGLILDHSPMFGEVHGRVRAQKSKETKGLRNSKYTYDTYIF